MDEHSFISVAIIEDDKIIRENLSILLNNSEDISCKDVYNSCESGIPIILEHKPELVLMDIELPGISGIEGIKKIKKANRDIDVIALTVHDEEKTVFDALCAGASGYLTKNANSEEILDAIRVVHRGGSPMSPQIARMVIESFHKNANSPLTKRETEVLQLLAKGKSYSNIAKHLFIELETVRTHIKHIYFKLEVHTRNDAVDKAEKNRLI